MEAEEVLEFTSHCKDKSVEEMREFYKRYKKEYPNMSLKDKVLLAKHWDVLEFLQMYAE